MDKLRLATFFFVMIFGGLLQLWVLVAILNASGTDISLPDLLADGGLFFFSTSLVAGSAITLLDTNGIKVGDLDFLVTLLVCAALFFLGVITYTTVMSATLEEGGNAVFKQHMKDQILCALIALLYWVYSGKRTGLFVKKV